LVRVLVLGAGVIGVTTAYALARQGHEVTVLERRGAVGEETSFANGGQISASHTDPWPSPTNLLKVLSWIGSANAPLKLSFTSDLRQYDWCLRFLANCTSSRAKINTERMLRVALYSRLKLAEILNEYPIDYHRRQCGMLHVFRDAKTYAEALRQAGFVRTLGCQRDDISIDRCLEIEPALEAVKDDLVGGFFCPQDESGDALVFTQKLAEICKSLGVTFEFDVSVAAFKTSAEHVLGVETTSGSYRANAYVLATGAYTSAIAETLGLTVPVYPAKGYSVTLPLRDPLTGPSVSLIDDENKLVYSRLGDNLRVAGTAEISGYSQHIDQTRTRQVLDGALAMYPGCTDPDDAEYWAGLRPQTPDSVPVIGRTPYKNLFLNTGHGTLGWTMACGSGAIIADLVSGRNPGVDLDGLEVERFTQWPKLFYRITGVQK
jgi:D-amino-acid dehydrogenase